MNQNSTKIKYGKKGIRINAAIFNAASLLRAPNNYIRSLIPDPSLMLEEITGVMCVWNEQENVSKAIKSSMGFVDRYIIVDKTGSTIPIIKEVQDQHHLDIDYHIEPSLSLWESRLMAFKKVKSVWILDQDGDEVFSTRGPYNIYSLRRYLKYPHILLRTRKNVLKIDYLHTQPIQNGYHSFLYYNNGEFWFKKKGAGLGNIVELRGRPIHLEGVYKWNCTGVKTPRELYYRRQYQRQYQEGDNPKKYPTLESFVQNYLGIEVDDKELYAWYNEYRKNVIPYQPIIQGPLPEILQKTLSNCDDNL